MTDEALWSGCSLYLATLYNALSPYLLCISCTGVLLIPWTCLALSSLRIFVQLFSVPETPSSLLHLILRSVLSSSWGGCFWPHYLSSIFIFHFLIYFFFGLVTLLPYVCFVAHLLIILLQLDRELHSRMDVVYPVAIMVPSVVVAQFVGWTTELNMRLIQKIPFFTGRLESNCPSTYFMPFIHWTCKQL